jgi:hypothetical protein
MDFGEKIGLSSSTTPIGTRGHMRAIDLHKPLPGRVLSKTGW